MAEGSRRGRDPDVGQGPVPRRLVAAAQAGDKPSPYASEPVWRGTRYLLVRHATAESAAPDAGLTVQGRAEAKALADRLGRWPFDAVWSSDLDRAVETARIIVSGREALPWQQSAALREVERPEGLDPTSDPDGYRAWEHGTLAKLAERLTRWLEIARMSVGDGSHHPNPLPLGEGTPGLPLPRGEGRGEGLGNRSILVVSHAGPLRVLLCLLLGLRPEHQWSFRLDCAGLTVVERCDDLGTLTLLNDRCHLNGAGVIHPRSRRIALGGADSW